MTLQIHANPLRGVGTKKDRKNEEKMGIIKRLFWVGGAMRHERGNINIMTGKIYSRDQNCKSQKIDFNFLEPK
jgi:hypothetical protein